MTGIEGLGWAVPRTSITADEYRQALGHFAPRIQEKTLPGYDEDEVTLAVEAGEHALRACGGDRSIEALAVVSALPVAVSTVAEALGLPAARAKAFGGTDAGPALLSCLDHAASGQGRALCIAVGTPPRDPGDPAEHGVGTAAVAAVCGRSGLSRVRSAHATAEAIATDRGGELARQALDRLAIDAADHVFSNERAPGAAAFLEKRFGKAVHGGLSWFTGDLGAASALANLAAGAARIQTAQSVVLLTVAPQSSTAVSFLSEAPLAVSGDLLGSMKRARRYLPFGQHLRRSLASSGNEPSQGAYVSPSAYLAELPARYRLVGEACRKCATLHFPPRETCKECGSREFEPRPLRRTGKVYTYTVIGRGAAPSEFAEQQAIWGEYATAIVELDDGPRITAMLTDTDPKTVKTGMPVEMAFRRIYTQEGVARYGFKFRPA